MTLREIDDEGNVRHNLESRLHLHHQCEKQNDKRILHEEKKPFVTLGNHESLM